MNEPKIAIFMSCYNHEPYVGEAINSVIQQTYENWELYVANDGSTDKTGEIIEAYTDERIHYYNFEKNTALIGTSNFLQDKINETDVKYIAVFSSDDKWEPDKLEKQVKYLENHPEYKCCFTWDKFIFNVEDSYKDNQDYSHKANKSRFHWIEDYFVNGNSMNACSSVMDKDVFYELGRMNQNFRQLADFRLWLRLACKYPFYVFTEQLTYYRRHDNNLSTPSLQVVARDANETFHIYSELMNEIDEFSFRKAFYQKLPYYKRGTIEEFQIDKFILLVNSHSHIKEQVAIEMYLEWCVNPVFLELLERKYSFTPRDFIELSGNGGLQYYILEVVQGKKVQALEDRFTPAQILVNAFSERHITERTLADYAYSTVIDLMQTVSGQSFEIVNRRIIQFRSGYQENLINKTVVFLIAEDSKTDVEKEFYDVINDSKNECYFAKIPSKKYFYEEYCYEAGREKHSEIKWIDLYDKKEHCLKFLWELDIQPDIMYYVDCINEEYSCMEMIAGYSLATKNIGVMPLADYTKFVSKNSGIVKIFDEIYTYEEER
ncbi:MAG: glycosyltransferase family 2 protein [Lachnospiraceae bacterium]|nr:glycosyltransferase family 2 protein [Lachnospiraceae bacterium]